MLKNLQIGSMIKKSLIQLIRNPQVGIVFPLKFRILMLRNLMIGMKKKMVNGQLL